MSDIGKKIDEIVKAAILPVMKDASFKKKGRNFRRSSEKCVLVANVQGNKWNAGTEGRFTMNLGAYWPEVNRIAEDLPVKGEPLECECTVRARIGQLLPERGDLWWALGPSTNIDELVAEVAKMMSTVALPWILSLRETAGLKAALDWQHLYWKRAALALLEGNNAEARAFVQMEIKRSKRILPLFQDWAKRHELLD